MFECDKCGGSGYITYVTLYENKKIKEERSCSCLNNFLNQSEPEQILDFMRKRIGTKEKKESRIIENRFHELKKHYNMFLSRYKQAEKYMARQDISQEEKMKWVPESQKITEKLGNILETIGVYTAEEALNGFAYEEE
jgi:Na+/phosphate symporter